MKTAKRTGDIVKFDGKEFQLLTVPAKQGRGCAIAYGYMIGDVVLGSVVRLFRLYFLLDKVVETQDLDKSISYVTFTQLKYDIEDHFIYLPDGEIVEWSHRVKIGPDYEVLEVA